MEQNRKIEMVPALIVGTFVAFALFIGYMVYRAVQSDVNLVREDYYAQELKHQEQIDMISRTAALGESVNFIEDGEKKNFVISFSEQIGKEGFKGEVFFYRPSSARLDFHLPIVLDEQKRFIIGTEKMAQGLWRVKVHFESKGESFFKETELHLK